jgi:hypothetical protein
MEDTLTVYDRISLAMSIGGSFEREIVVDALNLRSVSGK